MVAEPVVYINNPVFDLAEKFILQTSRSVFLTGKAGTGKTTFLRKIKSSTVKNTVVVAPTGVAAINAGGTTIHSFFQLPFTPFIPANRISKDSSLSDRYTLLQNLRIESEKRNLFRDLELLIIDEVSMVRCDVLDSIDIILRHYRRKEHLPFGGVQVLFIGDLFQLPPVVQTQEWSLLGEYYDSPFFFDAHVIREAPPLYIELKTIFRQRDEKFIDILNRVRNNIVTDADIAVLNERLDPGFQSAGEKKFITLTTHNYKAEKINNDELGRLDGILENFDSSVEGDFPERSFPTEKILSLKIGAQVMFIKNDLEKVRRYYNGKIGVISRIEGGKIFVSFPGEGDLEVEKDTWRNMRYSVNAEKAIEEEIIGTFTQYPLRLAWAVTIHKSQGLTFDNVIIDAGSSFAPGQVYVALSRCTTLEGIILKSKISRYAVKTEDRVLRFAEAELSEEKLQPLLTIEQQQFLLDGLIRIFDFSMAREEANEFRSVVGKNKVIDKAEALVLLEKIENALRQNQEVASRFASQLKVLMTNDDTNAILKRVEQGVTYFQKIYEEQVFGPLADYESGIKKLKKVRKFRKQLGALIDFLRANEQMLDRAGAVAETICEKRGIRAR